MTTCPAPLDSRRFQSALLLLLGPLFIGVSFVLMLRRVEPVTTLFYLCAWYGIIWTLDRLIQWREGRSLIARCGPAFLLILFWSAVGWYAFELINFRLQNWYYIFVLDHLVLQTLNAVFSFATVFPGLLWLEYYLGLRGVAAGWQGRCWSLTPRRLTLLQIVGLIGLALVLVWPRFFFPLTWLAFILLLAPVEYRRLPDSLLHQLARGDYSPLTRQLLAGFIAGGLWEFFNYWAQVKWIYTVPFFEELKLFEMPLAGFLGFPPFAVECALVYRLLVWYRLAPPLGAHRDQRLGPTKVWNAFVIVLLAAAFALTVNHYIYLNVGSVKPRLAKVDSLDPAARAFLQDEGIVYLTDLEAGESAEIWRQMEGALGRERTQGTRGLVELYLHQGIGVEYGNLLGKAGIRSLADLAALSAEQLEDRINALPGNVRRPTSAQIRLWIRRVPSP